MAGRTRGRPPHVRRLWRQLRGMPPSRRRRRRKTDSTRRGWAGAGSRWRMTARQSRRQVLILSLVETRHRENLQGRLALSRRDFASTPTNGCSTMTTEPALSLVAATNERPEASDWTTAQHRCSSNRMPSLHSGKLEAVGHGVVTTGTTTFIRAAATQACLAYGRGQTPMLRNVSTVLCKTATSYRLMDHATAVDALASFGAADHRKPSSRPSLTKASVTDVSGVSEPG